MSSKIYDVKKLIIDWYTKFFSPGEGTPGGPAGWERPPVPRDRHSQGDCQGKNQ